jgi:hypothetical protein
MAILSDMAKILLFSHTVFSYLCSPDNCGSQSILAQEKLEAFYSSSLLYLMQ